MPKQGGLGDNFYISGLDLSGDVSAISKIGGGPALLDSTGIKAYANERLGGKRDGSLDFSSWFNPYNPGVPSGMYLLPGADVIGSYFRGTTVGGEGAACVAKQINWDGSRGNDGSYSFAASLQANGYGVEWGEQHTAGIQLDAAPFSSAGLDSGSVGVSFGGQMYVHFFSVSGTSAVVKLQDFTTDVPASYTDVAGMTTGAITPAMCPTAVRVNIANNVLIRRWTRLVTTGVFTNLSFAVIFVRNLVAGVTF
jgi:hypothetical protein